MSLDVAFGVLPFADVDRPAIGVSLLKAEIERLGFSSQIVYCNFELADLVGVELFTRISESLPSESLVGEWFFADLLFGDRIPHEQDYVARVLSRFAQPSLVAQILEARKCRQEFVDRSLARFRALAPRLVGFTTTFHQTCACLALAQRLKQEPRPPLIVFGGANCEGEMGLQLLRLFPFIDFVCTREGDVAFPLLVRNVLRDGTQAPIPGILRQGESTEVTTPELVRNLDHLPIPDYTDYFTRLADFPQASKINTDLLIETSRGCWWGAKHHCTFCGLNGDTMEFRSKSPARAFEEMRFLSQTYGVKRINCVDNILDVRLIQSLFPLLQESGLGLDLFYEVKSNLRYDQVALLKSGGVNAIQPGVESFSNEILRIMDKGCTGLQNIQLLRWCEELGIMPAWNLLAGFPGEPLSEYERTAELLPLLTHLHPPTSCSPIRLDRFSPLFARAEQFGLQRVRPSPAYYYVYPFGRRELASLAYFFDFDYPDDRNPNAYIGEVRKEVDDWYQVHGPCTKPEEYARLDATCTEQGDVWITDTRPCAPVHTRLLTGPSADILVRCDSARNLPALLSHLEGAAREEDVRGALAELEAQKLLVEMDGYYGSLPVIRNRHPQSAIGVSHVPAEIPATTAAELLLRVI